MYMPEHFSELFVGKSPEEIREILKGRLLPSLQTGFKANSDYIDKCQENKQHVSIEAANQNSYYIKSLENIDETVESTIIESAKTLYREVEYLNYYCGNRSFEKKRQPAFQNIMNYRILPIINGFGQDSKALYEQIANTPYIDPAMVFHAYTSMVASNAITQAEYEEQAAAIRGTTEEDIKALADLKIRRGDNVQFGLLHQTRKELINELTKQKGLTGKQL